jgi:hypothetical protein
MSKRNKKQRPMIFHVGPWEYGVESTPGYLAVEGAKTDAAWVENERAILIEADAPPERRMSLVLWSLVRAWCAHSGEPNTSRGWYDLAATAMECFYHDLKKCGGRRALMKLRPSKCGNEPLDRKRN